MAQRVTRGQGRLEGFLARKRARMAERLLRSGDDAGRILDIGSGTHPLFLLGCGFRERYGVDQLVDPRGEEIEGVRLRHYTAGTDQRLPFDNHQFDAVTMLAVFEHIPPAALGPLLRDVRRVLKPEGRFVLTTPASWTDPILRTLARLGLVSSEEIDEHQDAYSHARIREYLMSAGFGEAGIRCGSFALGMNLWVSARA